MCNVTTDVEISNRSFGGVKGYLSTNDITSTRVFSEVKTLCTKYFNICIKNLFTKHIDDNSNKYYYTQCFHPSSDHKGGKGIPAVSTSDCPGYIEEIYRDSAGIKFKIYGEKLHDILQTAEAINMEDFRSTCKVDDSGLSWWTISTIGVVMLSIGGAAYFVYNKYINNNSHAPIDLRTHDSSAGLTNNYNINEHQDNLHIVSEDHDSAVVIGSVVNEGAYAV